MPNSQVPACYALTFDTLVLINTIEHSYNAFATLHVAYRLLRPGGLLIFSERCVKLSAHSQIYHPVRLTAAFYHSFLAQHFDSLFRFRGTSPAMRSKSFLQDEIFFIGRKKAVVQIQPQR